MIGGEKDLPSYFRVMRESVMLVLSRKRGESIILRRGDLVIKIIVTDTDRGKARIGIDAPLDVTIYRSELEEEHGTSEPAKS